MSALALSTDPVEIYSVYLQMGASAERTALTLRVPLAQVEALVKEHRWDLKARELAPEAGENPTQLDFQRGQRALNRSVNFVQAHRIRELVDRLLVKLLSNQDTLEEYTTVRTKDGFRRDIKPIRDLAEAAKAAQELTYRSLGDSMDVSVGDDRQAAQSGKDLQLTIMAAMDAADRNPKTHSVELIREGVKEREKKIKALTNLEKSVTVST